MSWPAPLPPSHERFAAALTSLLAAADASIEPGRVGHNTGGQLLVGSARGSKGLAELLELTGQSRQVAALIGVFDCLGREQQIVRRGAVRAF